MKTETCSCNPCHADVCKCSSRADAKPAANNGCCCGDACGCGEACDCPTSCGCN
ncbi:hypothetical protein [Vulgatibacter incomptus]|uniref:Metallothionein n=1 Tax=Vulgatibacter incomptus TaxID=1391653 RepID=A0A0K1PF06_9BACT|nr:hypothetical protein [Vulgatibacter incomptus]AKU92001.1 hypothetical protein AKJ08_2388 [Vulgatibacter incomptus]